jgi:UDP:flavonoid glycosyltransferase YjiC (YdhE family)
MKKIALIIPASIKSHVLPSFFLADMLSEDYEVTYAVTTKVLEESVLKNGFKTQKISRYKVGYEFEEDFVKEKGEKATFFKIAKCYLSNELYWNRKKEIDDLVEKVKPDIVILDIYSTTDFIFLHSHHTKPKVLFFNPMPSTYRVEGYPIVSENIWFNNDNSEPIKKGVKFLDFIKSPRQLFFQWVSEKQLQHLVKLSKISGEHDIVENKFIKAFNNVPELLLLPLEFEFSPAIKKNYQHYLGLCQRGNRIDTELDSTFEGKWQYILNKKQEGKKIIYCSFGTFFDIADPRLLDFINIVLNAITGVSDTFLICSVNKYVIQAIQSKHKELNNIMFFSRVPQLKILEIADLFITHGGLGGIKESIFYQVPMLVYPLDLNYDQSGNALKVEHHGIGLRGNFRYEQVPYMRAKINKLLKDKTYKNKIEELNNNVSKHYTPQYHKDLLNNILA